VSILESIILAAGYSSRFNFENSSFRKYLLPFERSNILNYVILGMYKAGISRINIIIDDKTEKSQITDSCTNFFEKIKIDRHKMDLNFIRNNYSERENGYSLFLGAREVSSETFILSMADHIFSVNVYDELIKNYKNQDILLATDPMKIDGFYDLAHSKFIKEAKEAASKIHAAGLNILFGDRNGNIGWWGAGKIPIPTVRNGHSRGRLSQ